MVQRIAVDARYLNAYYSGIAKYSENLLNSLAQVDKRNEYRVFIHRSFSRRLKVGDNFQIIPCRVPPLSLRTLTEFGRRVRRTGCSFLHSLSPVAPLFSVERTILTIHDLRPFLVEDNPQERRTLPSRVASLFHRATFPHFVDRATWLITVSDATRRRLTDLFPEAEHKAIVVHSGVEQSFLTEPSPTIRQMAAKRLDLPERYLLYVGSAEPNKNLPAMLRAFKRCLDEDPEHFGPLRFLLLLGRDRRWQTCERWVRELGLQERVRLLGPVTEEEKRVLYGRATLLFSVTRDEGFGFPIVEAQASGLPVLAGDDAAVPEVTHDSALLVDPYDEDMIAAKLGEVIRDADLRRTLSERGRENVKRFSWKRAAESVLEVYELLM